MTIIFSSSSPSATHHSDRLPHLLIPSPAQISSIAREPPSHIYAGRISAFMARQSKWNGWISRLVGYPNFRAHSSNSHRFFALRTVFGVEWSNLSGVERS
ncbi:hypothetical protein AVEN_168137-1 [Araneus ventricosus]|uniref:Uncharacterized protein n=1 Tax=Araneus ventricosus TaxID=182803 RepID=A0A4Y2NCZ9_ARAVE|nr:hypothetical protein AVEN_168137-1 [Araneus ventricosus]